MNSTNPLRRPFSYRHYNVSLFLIGINIFVFLLSYINRNIGELLVLRPILVINYGYVWQLVTYMFMHAGFQHILFNMLGLFLFGIQLERHMGSSEFLLLYMFAGIGTGLVSLVVGVNLVGASGAIYGLLLAFATYFPHARIFIMGIIPMKAPLAVTLFALLSIFFELTGIMGGVAHFAHLAGILLAYLYFVVRLGINPIRIFLRGR